MSVRLGPLRTEESRPAGLQISQSELARSEAGSLRCLQTEAMRRHVPVVDWARRHGEGSDPAAQGERQVEIGTV